MIFNLLCAPCFAAMGAIKREITTPPAPPHPLPFPHHIGPPPPPQEVRHLTDIPAGKK